MDVNLIITDNFLQSADHVREQVLQLPFERDGVFPGMRSDSADEEYRRFIQTKIEAILNVKITAWKLDSNRLHRRLFPKSEMCHWFVNAHIT